MTEPGYATAVRHVGHKVGVVDEGAWARLICRDCGVTLAGVSKAENDFLYDSWVGHADPVADGLPVGQYNTLDPDDPGFPEHWVVCVAYGFASDPENVAVECEHCGVVLEDWDRDER